MIRASAHPGYGCLALLVMVLSSCAEGPTGPDRVAGERRNHDYLLEGIEAVVSPSGCTDPNRCVAPTPPSGQTENSGGGTDGGTGLPGTPPDSVPDDTLKCNTGDEVIDSPAVSEYGLDLLWDQSNYSPTTPQNERREMAAWIVRLPSGAIRLELFQNAEFLPCRINVTGGAVPPGTIGFVHTHPWAVGEQQTSCEPISIGGRNFYNTYRGRPSDVDVQSARTVGTSYIIDASGITRYDGSGQSRRFRRCGY